jgi:hypothetical protein
MPPDKSRDEIEAQDENVLPSLSKAIRIMGDKVSFMSSIGDELAAYHCHLYFRSDGCHLPA